MDCELKIKRKYDYVPFKFTDMDNNTENVKLISDKKFLSINYLENTNREKKLKSDIFALNLILINCFHSELMWPSRSFWDGKHLRFGSGVREGTRVTSGFVLDVKKERN